MDSGVDGDGEESTSVQHPGFAGLPEVHHESYGEPNFVRSKFTDVSNHESGGESGTGVYEDCFLGATSERGSYGQRSRTIGQESGIREAFTSPRTEGMKEGLVDDRGVLGQKSRKMEHGDGLAKVNRKSSFARVHL